MNDVSNEIKPYDDDFKKPQSKEFKEEFGPENTDEAITDLPEDLGTGIEETK
jgi:hypothetical protein